MRTTCPFVDKFFVDVETFYYPDAGQQVQCMEKSIYSSQCAQLWLHDCSSQTWTNIKQTNFNDRLEKSQWVGGTPFDYLQV